jgi:hypothetical protein
VAGGWNQTYGRRTATGIKPPRLIREAATTSPGEKIFVTVEDLEEKIRHITCHELTHAFTSHLKLPVWLNEGLAMVTVDMLAGRPTVKKDTLCLLEGLEDDWPLGARGTDSEGLVQLYARSYWLVRYLTETQFDTLKALLEKRQNHRALEQRLAAACGLAGSPFPLIEDRAVAHFR